MHFQNNQPYQSTLIFSQQLLVPYYSLHNFQYQIIPNYSIYTIFPNQILQNQSLNLSQEQPTDPSPKIVENTVLKTDLNKLIKKQNKKKVPSFQKNLNTEMKFNQKEGRNVLSNLLRIFLKNLFQLRKFESQIASIINKHRINITKDQFITWIAGFSINYKNYIKVNAVKRILASRSQPQYVFVLKILLSQFAQQLGIVHCLTSKRLQNKQSMRMHLVGLRQLRLFVFQ